MRATVIALAAGFLASSPALAEECKIEDWKADYQSMMKALTIEGVTTCKTGRMQLRLYDGEGDTRKFVGVETAFIEGHIFETIIMPTEKPNALSLKYTIEAE